MDPHIFADPDLGSQNLADPTDPDPYLKNWFGGYLVNIDESPLFNTASISQIYR